MHTARRRDRIGLVRPAASDGVQIRCLADYDQIFDLDGGAATRAPYTLGRGDTRYAHLRQSSTRTSKPAVATNHRALLGRWQGTRRALVALG